MENKNSNDKMSTIILHDIKDDKGQCNIDFDMANGNLVDEVKVDSNGTGNDEQGDENTKERTHHYKTATNEDKLKILKIAKEIGNAKAARMFDTSRTNIIYWRKQENKIRACIGNKKGKKRSVEDTVNRVKHPEMEIILDQWLKDQHKKGLRVKKAKITAKAREIVDELAGETTNFADTEDKAGLLMASHDVNPVVQ